MEAGVYQNSEYQQGFSTDRSFYHRGLVPLDLSKSPTSGDDEMNSSLMSHPCMDDHSSHSHHLYNAYTSLQYGYPTHLQPQPIGPNAADRTPSKTTARRKGSRRHRDMMVKRLVANTQERSRMRRLNDALEELRSVIPTTFHLYHRRLSKIKTLRMAISYIAALSDALNSDNHDESGHGGGGLAMDANFGGALLDASGQRGPGDLDGRVDVGSSGEGQVSELSYSSPSPPSHPQHHQPSEERVDAAVGRLTGEHTWSYASPDTGSPHPAHPSSRSAYETPVLSRIAHQPRFYGRTLLDLRSPPSAHREPVQTETLKPEHP